MAARCEHVASHLLTFLHRISYATAELHLVTLCVEHKVRCPRLRVTRCCLYATRYILMATQLKLILLFVGTIEGGVRAGGHPIDL